MFCTASKPKLTNLSEVQDAIRGLKVDKTPHPNGIPCGALKHLSESVLSLLVKVITAILRMQ
jgi:hypothetical protein